ncbi:MAG TPA: hypothetical protein VJ824_04750 [Bacillota bacterium]|nr:hypothetical protein [Bacillota bacterium]
MTNATKFFMVILFSLAAVGLVISLQANPLMVILSIVFAVLILFALSRFSGGRTNRYTDKGYQRALRNQKRKGKITPVEVQKLTRLKRQPGQNPFKVIEGNKGKPPKDKEKKSYYH